MSVDTSNATATAGVDPSRAQRIRSLFGADLALCQRRQFPGNPHRDGFSRRRPATRDARQRGAGRSADRQCRLSVEFSGCPLSDAGHDGVRIDNDKHLAADRSDFPLAVSRRRSFPAGLAGSSGIVGQLIVADLGCASDLGVAALGADPQRPRAATARSLQRPQRYVQQLNARSPDAARHEVMRG